MLVSRLAYELLNAEFPPIKLTEALAALLRSGQMSTRDRKQFTMYESDTLTVWLCT